MSPKKSRILKTPASWMAHRKITPSPNCNFVFNVGLLRGEDGMQHTETLTHAQITALGAVGIDVVPGVTGKLLVPIACILVFHSIDPYATLAADTATHDLALTVGGIAVTHWGSSALLLTADASSRWIKMHDNDSTDASGLPDSGSDLLVGEPIQLWNWSGVEYTAGHADNTVDVHTIYQELVIT